MQLTTGAIRIDVVVGLEALGHYILGTVFRLHRQQLSVETVARYDENIVEIEFSVGGNFQSDHEILLNVKVVRIRIGFTLLEHHSTSGHIGTVWHGGNATVELAILDQRFDLGTWLSRLVVVQHEAVQVRLGNRSSYFDRSFEVQLHQL